MNRTATAAAPLPFIALPRELIKLIPYELMRRHKIMPLEIKDNRLRLAMARPNDLAALENARILTGYEIEAVPAVPEELSDALQRLFSDHADHPSCPELVIEPSYSPNESGQAETHVVKTLDKLLDLAVRMRASDIHLEPQRQGLFIRFRIDGVLKTIHEFPKAEQPAIVSRIKVMAGMDITERRLPQDGQAGMPYEDKVIDLRISTLPGKYGEKVVIRILDKSGLALGLERLGMDAPMQSEFESLIERPHGLILVTGPTGSGKTTTLYAVLNRLKSPLKNVITLEDPIEYELLADSANEMGITQVQVQPKIGLTFAAGLRSALRQDPDVIMVGEIRDKETAETAMAAAMTGHLVLSTLHTNDAPGALGRLMDMGVERYLIASTVIASLAQRLVRLLCPRCKEAYRPPARALEKLFPQRPGIAQAKFYRTKGCENCQGSGYWGRCGIFELLAMTDEVKQSLHAGESLQNIRDRMRTQGLRALRESGMELVLQGLTTVEEVARVSTE